ncbi:TIGR01906 family membrane protein [Wukongibacter baidiensis]|uniref:TIGR01906 family membrane protein n=1 Tax=Wukongibacter baidiensis TaxID=1723361 RepID=UPI003D7F9E09
MNNQKLLINISKTLIIIFLPLVILLTALQYYSYNQDFYMSEFEKYDISKVTKMTKDDLSRVSHKLISYLKDDDKNLNMMAVIKGESREVFGQREKQHMVDVKELFIKGKRLRNISLAITLLGIVIIFLFPKDRKRNIYKALFWSGIIPVLLMTILYILLKIDFYKYFTYFHEIFFTNDLWLLNPETEVLIQMLPLEFFIDISIRIIGWFLGISIAMTIISFIGLRKESLITK